MAQIRYIGKNEDQLLYNDGDQVEQDILQYVKTNPDDDYTEIIRSDERWPVFYHLTDMRENILNWYDFKKNADILEIGGGMGALTGLLCRKAKSVTVVELTNRRAEVIYTRHAGYDNLSILAGNFNEIEFDQKYDYITLIGVLEYSPGFTQDGEPLTFLKKIRSLLKPGGKLLIAIENRFGLKYWCGAEEDHTGKVFDGINGYPGNREIRTFSRAELVTLLRDCGLGEQRFYYPLPDYKLPQVLYSDEYLPREKIPSRIRKYYLNQPTLLADERQVYRDVIQNNAFPFMANSFFVECSERPEEGSHPVFALFTPDRKKKYRTSTVIYSDDTVRKYPVYPEAMNHLKEVYGYQKLFKADNLEKYTLKEDCLEMPFIHGGTNLEDILYNAVRNGDLEQARSWISRFYDHILASSELIDKGKKRVLKNGFLDMTFGNCIVKGDRFTFFDQEWIKQNVAPEYILVHAIEVLYWENPDLEGIIPHQALILPYVGNLRTVKQYDRMNTQMIQDIYGTEKTALYYLDAHGGKVDLDASIRGGETVIPEASDIVCTVYYHDENGYSEQNAFRVRKTVSSVYGNTIIAEELPIPDKCDEIRIDPCEGSFCSVSDLSISCGGETLNGNPVNGFAYHNMILFSNEDPQIIVRLPEDRKNRLRMGMNIRRYSSADPLFITLREEQTARENALREQLAEKEREQAESSRAYESRLAEKEREQAESSRAYESRLAEKEREQAESSRAYESRLAEKEREQAENCRVYERRLAEKERELEKEYTAREQELTANIQHLMSLCAEKDRIIIENGNA